MGDIVRVERRGKFIGWYVRYIDADGRRKQRASHQPSQALARRYLLEIEGRVARGIVGIPERTPPAPSVAQVIERFLVEYSRARLKNLERYQYNARIALQRALPLLGKMPIDAVTAADINRLRVEMKRYAARTIRLTFAFLGTLFTWAIREGLVTKNPLVGIEKPPTEALVEYLSKDEVETLIATARRLAEAGGLAQRMRYCCILFALHTGLRKGELLGLRWLDVDLETRRLTVARSYQGTPKSGKTRHLRLPSAVVPFLSAWRKECPRTPDGLVFPVIVHGRPITGTQNHMMDLHAVIEASGCRPVSHPWHCLRHTFASHFVMAGGNILSLQKILGHSDIKMTLVYAHLAPDFLGDEMDRLKWV